MQQQGKGERESCTFLNSFTLVTGHCMCCQLMGTIVLSAALLARITPYSFLAVERK